MRMTDNVQTAHISFTETPIPPVKCTASGNITLPLIFVNKNMKEFQNCCMFELLKYTQLPQLTKSYLYKFDDSYINFTMQYKRNDER